MHGGVTGTAREGLPMSIKILEKSEVAKLNRIVSRTVSNAVRGVLYAEVGLLDEAEREFQIHLGLRPSDERARQLLQMIKSWRGAEAYLPPSQSTPEPSQ